MNIFDKLRLAWKMASTPIDMTSEIMGMLSVTPPNDPDHYIQQGYKSNAKVYSAINAMMRPFIKTRYQLYRGIEDRKRITDSDVIKLFHKPNAWQGWGDFMGNCFGMKKLTGEVLIHKLSAISGRAPSQLYMIPTPLLVRVDTKAGAPETYVFWIKGREHKIPAQEIIHIKEHNPEDPTRGLSPLSAAAMVIQQSNDGNKTLSRMLRNGGPAGILRMIRLNDGSATTKEQAEGLQREWDDRNTGPAARGKILIIPNEVTWTQIGVPATDLELIEAQKMALRDICDVYGFSSQILNDPDNKTFNNIREAEKQLIERIIIPEHEQWMSVFERSLLPDFFPDDEYTIDIDTSVYDVLKIGFNEQATALATSWWLTPNQRLEAQGYETDPDPAMDMRYIPAGLLPITDESLLNGGAE